MSGAIPHVPSAAPRNSILLRPKRPDAARVNEESIDRQWRIEQQLMEDKRAERAAAERERERWGHQHEFDREEMHHRLMTEREAHLTLKSQAAAADAEMERQLSELPGHWAPDFQRAAETAAARREATRTAMEENARLMRERLEAARAEKLDEVTDEAAHGDVFNERFTKPAWREQMKGNAATRAAALGGVVPGLEY